MKPRTLKRLNLLAAAQETQCLEAIRRHNAALDHAEYQRGVLAAYRDRLGLSWQNGAVLPAAQAYRAGQFVTASHGAQAQIDQAAHIASGQLELAIGSLAQTQARLRVLADAQRKLVLVTEREAARQQERDRPSAIFIKHKLPLAPQET